jgi:protein-arginine kinase activator protein McsA
MKRDYHGRFIRGHRGFNKGKRLSEYEIIVCPVCKTEFEDRKSRNREYCSRKCVYKDKKKLVGEKATQWKGGRTKHNGYIYVYAPNHPFAENKGYVFEHRLVIEKYIGRYLTQNEVVHHINHIKDDNRIKNLMLLTRTEHIKLDGPKQCRT